MKNINEFSQDRLLMIQTNLKVASGLRKQIASFDDASQEDHYEAERKLSVLVNFLEMQLLGEQCPNMNIFKRYDRIAQYVPVVEQLLSAK